ncbi:MAG: Sensor histidine kinase RcsC [Chroococcidiopsis cubana SAG 39.79]|uniref:histidine kinase n=1 Tax=Chroococcidiopsis cubana SAG 39.79 TaxID=388085 RepID=A0AB37UJS2_9CYAN|nr:response regulator [Chroococcidiopsis cubana]MDZ4875453.1 Sensor histidine kinase RcsC [Chroococcidiopsis cubana SAG 39.79]PSB65689.1 hybrid sensor histidine kinase/response regulator [Chroococcidiopsis cubana CCALA 043]RUT11621.1 histidine kinase [Chroococcidiopsis cubana SAG 39.79]
MNLHLRILVVEDSEDDMLLMLRELRRSGHSVDYERVETAAQMQAALDRQSWDIVIADYTLPAFSAPDALKLLQSQQRNLPFIIVSGTIGEETAVAAMKAGAHDYITKGNLARLMPAVERELREAKERQKRHNAEQALRESEERFRQLAENIAESVFWMSDPKARQQLYVSPAYERIWGRSCESLYANFMEWLEAIHPEDRQRIQTKFFEQALAGHYDEEYRIIRPDGSIRWIRDRGFPIQNDSGASYRVVGIAEDITTRKLTEAALRHAQRLESLGTLASGIAHDFNNILTPILATAQLLSLKLPLDEQDRHLLQLIEDSAKRGADLVKQILVFARGVEGKRVPLQLRHILSEVMHVARQTFPKTIEIYTDFPTANLWTVAADATQLHQVFMNLCVNARDAMPNGGTLGLAAENKLVDEACTRMNPEASPGSYVAIAISDTGTGIPSELLERIFDPFFTTKEVGKGTGLGLSTALGIVKNHGGFVKVYSEVGRGSQFKVYLPAIEDAETQPAAELALLTGNNELILIVEDELSIQQVTQTSLEEYNYRTLIAKDGIEAIALYAARKYEIDLVLMDVMMPLMDGLTATRTLQKLNPKIKAIVTSGLASNSLMAEITEIGVKAFLPKPYTTKELLDAIHKVLQLDR